MRWPTIPYAATSPVDLGKAAALLLALAAVGLTLAQGRPSSHTTLVVAAHALRPGAKVAPGDVRVVEVPAHLPGMLASPSQVVGQRLAIPIAQGEPILSGSLLPAGPPRLMATLPATAPAEPGSRVLVVLVAGTRPGAVLGEGIVVEPVLTQGSGQPALTVTLPRRLLPLLALHSQGLVAIPLSP